jgi:hypothetical protein
MKTSAIAVVAVIAIAICGTAFAIAWPKAAREQHRTDVAKDCIEAGGGYSESWLRRRPKCKLPRHHD